MSDVVQILILFGVAYSASALWFMQTDMNNILAALSKLSTEQARSANAKEPK